jgi:exopolysaccharide biosynthesis polyprenyl glycosylphosphotransferase
MRVFSEPYLFEEVVGGPEYVSVPRSRVSPDTDPVAEAVVSALGEGPQPVRRPGSLVEAASLVVADVAGLAISAVLGIAIARSAGLIGPEVSSAGGAVSGILAALSIFAALILHGAYRRHRQHLLPRIGSGTRAMVLGYPSSVLLLTALSNVTGHHLSLSAVLLLLAPSVVIVPLGRRLARALPLPGRAQTARVLIVGSGKVAKRVADRLSRVDRLEVVGMADDDPAPGETVLGPTSDLVALVDTYRVDQVLVAFSRAPGTSTLNSLRDLRGRVGVAVVPRMFEMLSWRSALEEIHGIPLLHVAPAQLTVSARITKRTLDLLISSLILLAIAPVLITAAVAIKLTSPGPVFFRQQRWGRSGKPFSIYKLRSMRVGAEADQAAMKETNQVDGPLFKVVDDPRITTVGAFLRRTSIDELPQLLNVLKGDMSLVGPRPFIPSEASQIEGSAARRYEVQPGMTGLWQISGRSELSYEDLCHLDTVYVSSWSLWWDLRILSQTPAAVLKRSGAY